MKKILVFVVTILLLTGCGREFKIYGKTIVLDKKIEFRHIQYRTSDVFDYGSDGDYRYYNLYDKKQNVQYSISIEKMKGSYQDNVKKIKDDTLHKSVKENSLSLKGIKWQTVTYQKDEKNHHVYYVPYDKNEYYKIEFFNSNGKTADFEKKFLSYVRLS